MSRSPFYGRALSAAALASVLAPTARAAEPASPAAPAAVPAAPAPAADVSEAEEMKFTAPAPAETAVPAAPGRARTMEEVAASSELSIRAVHWRYSLNFFGDVSLSLGKPNADHLLGFALGDQDILIRGELGSNFVATTEFAMEPGDDGVGVDIERYNVRWQTPTFYLEAGRAHTQLGYWNNAYHHGRWLQLTIQRPRWVAFEDDDGVLPVHWIGVNAGGKIPVGTGHLDLSVSIGNGRGNIVDDVRTTHDYQNMKAVHASAEFVGLFKTDLRFGVSAVFDRILANSARVLVPNDDIGEMIGGVHVAYPSVPLIFIAEAYTIVHSAINHRWATFGGFGLLGYAFGRVTPYVELESFNSQGGPDPFFVQDPALVTPSGFDTFEGIGGVRIDLSDWTALKAEYRQLRFLDDGRTIYEGIVNWSWGY